MPVFSRKEDMSTISTMAKDGDGVESTPATTTAVVATKERKPLRFNLFARKGKGHVKLEEQAPPVVDENRTEEKVEKEAVTSNKSNTSKQAKKKGKNQKKIVYDSFGSVDELMTWTTNGIPQVEDQNDVVVKIEASSVSMHDCFTRRGICFSVTDPTCLPATPGMDLVGYIVKVGTNVKDHKIGDRVAALVRTGGNARYCVVSQNSLVNVPRQLDAGDAVAMVSVYMTAYQSLDAIETIEGSSVLVIGGIGPVEQALIQLAWTTGANKVYCIAPEHRHRYVKSFLNATPLPPNQWLPTVEGKMDIVFDSSCQDGFDSSYKALNLTGTLVCVGMSTLLRNQPMGAFGAPMSAFWAKTKAQFFMDNTKFYDVWESFQSDPVTFKSDLTQLFALLSKREIKPHIAKRIALADVPDAQAMLEKGHPRGIIVCLPWRRLKVTGLHVNAIKCGGRDQPDP